MAQFLEVLADTGIVTEGCRSAGMSRDSAYSLRNRDTVFDSAWRAALTKARPLIADGILERSITGTVEHYYRDGVLVGERRHYESWLALAVLKRLDKLADEERGEKSLSAEIAGNWKVALDAFRAGGSNAIPEALEAEADKDYTPPPRLRSLLAKQWQLPRRGRISASRGRLDDQLPAAARLSAMRAERVMASTITNASARPRKRRFSMAK